MTRQPPLPHHHQLGAVSCAIDAIRMIRDGQKFGRAKVDQTDSQEFRAFLKERLEATGIYTVAGKGSDFAKLVLVLKEFPLTVTHHTSESIYGADTVLKVNSGGFSLMLSALNSRGEAHVIVIDHIYANGTVDIRDPDEYQVEYGVNPADDGRIARPELCNFYLIGPNKT